MAKAGLLAGWGALITGREKVAQDGLGDGVQYL